MKTSSNQSSEASAPIFNSDKHNMKETSNNNSFSSSSYNEKDDKTHNDKKIVNNSKNNFSSNNNIGNTFVHFNGHEVKKNQKKVNNACFSELYIAPNKFTICNNKEILKNCDALISNTMNQEYRNKIKLHNNMYSNNASLNVSKNPSENSINVHARHNSNRFNEEALYRKEKLTLSPKTR